MPTLTSPTAEDRRIARWQRVTGGSGKFHRWRRPGPTRALIACYFSAVGLLPVTLLASLFWGAAIWFHLTITVAMMVAWTLLRGAIDIKDSAPETVLDEYERSVLDTWRRRSQRLFSNLLLGAGFVVLIIGTVFHEHLTVIGLTVVCALTMFMIGLVAGSLPAVGYALTFHTTEKE
ncbi:hypothetical protein [Corynebacterium halotolerans]|uniref:Uncharacterized protein n=1 Tax=Corynebacterium halotolerans YIM 70093 = DSM 44683 TaxID=1121362 RepID=M1NK76_9CORY|nr:hypothetical protein [Corynebacterium halotolerans]AGF71818.1 hypothetical protein A605_04035 [Corynebacterium halotolerans YIM 70093 = DSM 44683]